PCLPQNPYDFTPFTQKGELKGEEGLEPGINRMKTVLKRMYQNEFITKEEYSEALEYDIVADFTDKKESPAEKYPAIVFEVEKQARKILRKQLDEEDEFTDEDLEYNEDIYEQYDT